MSGKRFDNGQYRQLLSQQAAIPSVQIAQSHLNRWRDRATAPKPASRDNRSER
jgi:hypothetical protein